MSATTPSRCASVSSTVSEYISRPRLPRLERAFKYARHFHRQRIRYGLPGRFYIPPTPDAAGRPTRSSIHQKFNIDGIGVARGMATMIADTGGTCFFVQRR